MTAAQAGDDVVAPAPRATMAPTSIRYKITAIRPLPALDLSLTVKQQLLTAAQLRAFHRVIHALRHVAFPLYLAGYALRCAVIFGPVTTGEALAPLALVVQLPVMAQVMLSYRVAFFRVLTSTFEFGFMLVNTTIWVVCLGAYLADARAFLAPPCYVDFVNLMLIEAYFQDATNVAVGASVAAAFQLALSVGVSLHAIPNARSVTLMGDDTLTSEPKHSIALKDALVNTMATMVMLLVRLAFRKIESLRKQQRDANAWTQSIGYRCRTMLREVGAVDSALDTAATATTTDGSDAASVETVAGKTLMRMRFVHVATVFDASDTLLPRCGAALLQCVQHWPRTFALLHKGAGAIGGALLPVMFICDSSNEALTLALALVVLATTLAFWLPMLCCAQRLLAWRLWTSFDFVFLAAQFVFAIVALGDMLSWRPAACCGLLAGFVWIQGVLSVDALPPVMRVRLGWRAWFIVPPLLLFMTIQIVLCVDIVVSHYVAVRNRLLLDSAIGRYRLQFYVVPFFLSRQFTIFIWFVRILHRFRTRHSEHELLLLLGDVEYNFASWRAARRAPPMREPADTTTTSMTAVVPLPLARDDTPSLLLLPRDRFAMRESPSVLRLASCSSNRVNVTAVEPSSD